MSSNDRGNNWKQVLKTQQSDLEKLQVIVFYFNIIDFSAITH